MKMIFGLMQAVGAVSVTIGVGMWSVAAGFVAAGLVLFAAGAYGEHR